jgi:hypothetical protein
MKHNRLFVLLILGCSGSYAANAMRFASTIPVGATWNYVLKETPKLNTPQIAQTYNIDGFNSTATDVATLHANGAKVICYISAGTAESWRPDIKDLPVSLLGKRVKGFQDEKWVDIRKASILLPLMEKRVTMCRDKGFDAIEWDNVDGYSNATGFKITAQDQINYNKALASLGHKYNLAVGLKNDLAQVKELVTSFDFAVNEQCYQYKECAALAPFYTAGKAILNVEYKKEHINCIDAKQKNISSTYKTIDLNETPFSPC